MSATQFMSETLKPSDRRAHPRLDARYEIYYDYYGLDGSKLGAGYATTINVSPGGMLLETDKSLQDGMILTVEIISPLYAFMATAVTVYVVQMGEHRFRVGLSFQETIQGGWEQIAMQTQPHKA
jgi:hypothetical protein